MAINIVTNQNILIGYNFQIKKRIVSSLEYLPHSNFQKRIVSAETIRGNTVFNFDRADQS